MKSIPSAIAREVEITLPAFVKAVQVKNADHLMTTLDAFHDDRELFYKCIWYANSHGKSVKVMPTVEQLSREEGETDRSDQ
jgi:hypothetical protein